MRSRIRDIGESLHASFWLIPTAMTLASFALAYATLLADDAVSWTYGGLLANGGVDGARVVLGTIAGTMVTVGATVFSITIVAMTLASSQFGPRMLANFMRDRGNQATMGVFIAVFLYALLILRTVHSGPGGVPNISVSVACALAVVAILVLIYYIHHIAHGIQVMNLAKSIADDLAAAIDSLFPDLDDVEEGSAAHDEPELRGEGAELTAQSSGYVEFIDLDTVITAARDHDLIIRLDIRPGRFAVHHTPVAQVWTGEGEPAQLDDDVAQELARAIITGARRKMNQDVEFPLRQLVEVAVRALSPAINDPFTASACSRHICVSLCTAAARRLPPRLLADSDGRTRVVIGDPITFERLVGVAYDQIRQAADFHVIVYITLLECLTKIARCSDQPSRREPVLRQAALVLERAEQTVAQEADMAVVRARYDNLLRVAGEPRR